MSTIAIVPSDVTSKRMLAERLGKLLIEAGHRVVMLVDLEDPADAGEPFEQRRVPIRFSSGRLGFRWRPLGLWRANRDAASALDPSELATVLMEVEPDLIIIDIEEYEALILALAIPASPPLVVLCSFFEVWPIAGLGPNDPGPAGGVIGRVRGALLWSWMWFRLRVHDVKRQLVGGEIDRISVSRALARHLKVRRLFTGRQWLHPFAPRFLPMLVCNAVELDIPHEPRPGVIHIGSLLDPVESDAAAAIDDPGLADVIVRAREDGRLIVLCAFGTLTTGDRTALIRRIAGVARLRPDVQFVVGATVEGREAAFSELPNVYAGSWIPQRAVLTVADAALVHTGNATIHECVAARVPMVAHPFAVNDQQRNAARVVRHGIGALDGGDGDDAATLAARLDAVILDEAMSRRINDLAEHVTRYERDGVAVAAVEGLLRGARGHLIDPAHSRP
jgi:UDP:flavonoid glycosyltransferase YjiC (YdhE family)